MAKKRRVQNGAARLTVVLVFLAFLQATAAPDAGSVPSVTPEAYQAIEAARELAATDLPAAIEQLAAFQGPPCAAREAVLAALHARNNDLDAAVAAYRRALEILPDFRDAMLDLGRVLLLQERTAEAIALYRRHVVRGMTDAALLRLLGHALLMDNRPVAAETAYRQSLLFEDDHHEARQGLVKALFQQSRFAEGLALIDESLADDPLHRELWSLRANAFLMTEQFDAAVRSLETARRLNRADAEMLATLGDLWLNRAQPVDALRAYQAAFDGGRLSLARRLRAVEGFLMVGDTGKASVMLAEAETALAGLSPVDAPSTRRQWMRLRVRWLRQTGQIEAALEQCRSLLQADPLDGHALLLLAELLFESGAVDHAVMTCERAARIAGFEAEAWVLQARIEASRAHYARARVLLESAQRVAPQPHVDRMIEQLRRVEE